MNRLLHFVYHRYGPLLALTAFAVVLILLRVCITSTSFYTFLLWNLFLAVLPYTLGQIIKRNGLAHGRLRFGMPLFIIWLLLLPNAPYLMTDLVHLHSPHSNWKWFDLFTVFVFGLAGLFFGALSILDMQGILWLRFGGKVARALTFTICLLTGYGMYLGRFLRFNSWDVLLKPKQVAIHALSALGHPKVWMLSLAFGTFLWLVVRALHWVKQGG